MSLGSDRPFPIQRDGMEPATTIPWWLAEIAYREYSKRFGNQQSLERLHDRGGFGRAELVALLRGDNPITEPACLCPADGFYSLCPVHKTNHGTPR